ncbi:MAG: hypothetical protein ACOCUT_03460 [bacterium]
MSISLIRLLDELTEDECLEHKEEKTIEHLIEILNSYEIKTPKDLENKLKKPKDYKPITKNESSATLSKTMDEISECFFDSGENIHVPVEKEDTYKTTLLSLSYLFDLYKIDTTNDLKNTLGKSLLTDTFKKSSHTVPEDDMADIIINLAASYQEAGGCIPSIEELKNISAFEFIRRIAPNKIRFCVFAKK